MKQPRRVPLHVEALEDRWVPAAVKFTGGSLFVSNPLITGGSASLSLKQTAPNTFQVVDGSVTLGTYSGVGNLFLSGSNAKDKITVDLNGNAYTGNLFVSSGNGNDTVNLGNTGAAAGMGGNVTVLTGFGDDSVGISSSTSVSKIGGSIQVNSQDGNDSFALGNGTASTAIGGNVTITGFTTVALGAGKTDQVGGSVTIENALTATGNSVTLANNFTIGENLAYTGGSGADTVTYGSFAILGDMTLNLAGGNNTTVLNTATTLWSVGGNMTITAGSGDNTIGGASNNPPLSTVGGDMNVNLGDGNNQLFGLNQFFIVGGNVNFTLGNGNNTGALFPSLDQLENGTFTMKVGNGTNAFRVNGDPGGQFVYRSGNGVNNLTLGQGQLFIPNPPSAVGSGLTLNVNIAFGSNDDTLTVNIGSGNTLTGQVNGGGRLTANTFNLISGILSPPFQLSNFP
jgi:hypothetical protein